MKDRSKPSSRKRTNYPAFWKRKIVEVVLCGLLSEQQACEKYNLSAKKLRQWYAWYHKNRHFALSKAQTMKNSGKDRITELEAQLAAAQNKIKELELQKTKLETVLKIAEKEFDIDIEKKSGSKPLHK